MFTYVNWLDTGACETNWRMRRFINLVRYISSCNLRKPSSCKEHKLAESWLLKNLQKFDEKRWEKHLFWRWGFGRTENEF